MWFGGLAAAADRQAPGNQGANQQPNPDPQNLLVPDPPLQEDMAPTVNYDAHHADDEVAGAMEKAVNMLRNFVWQEDDLAFYFSQVEVKMK